MVLPVLLDFPPPRLRAYARESTIAEKLHAMVELGLGNSRMKDYYDLWFLSTEYAFDGNVLANAVLSTGAGPHFRTRNQSAFLTTSRLMP